MKSLKQSYPTAFTLLVFALLLLGGCDKQEGIVQYKIPKKVPEQLLPEDDRLLAVMVPRGDKVWFFKVMGAESSVDLIDEAFRGFVQSVQFDDQNEPVLDNLPEGWRRGGIKPMRHATIDINTSKKQLDLSISFLTGPSVEDQEEWDAYVVQNVDRWRGQVGLEPSTDKWAGGQPIEVPQAQGPSVWVDVIGQAGSGAPPMAGMGGGMMGGGMMGGPMSGAAPTGATPPSAAPTGPPSASAGANATEIEHVGPEGWQKQAARGMRELVYQVGEGETSAEVTLITAGGDLRSNVARWMKQVAGQAPEDAAVDEMLAGAEKFDVSGRPAQRFIIPGDVEKGQDSIDATIVEFEQGRSKFIKMTGHPETVAEQSNSMRTFLDSLSF